jgi:hypothetical protein
MQKEELKLSGYNMETRIQNFFITKLPRDKGRTTSISSSITRDLK